jgi:hypothetical protein
MVDLEHMLMRCECLHKERDTMNLIKPSAELIQALTGDRVRYVPVRVSETMPTKPLEQWTKEDFRGMDYDVPESMFDPLTQAYEQMVFGDLVDLVATEFQGESVGIRGTVISLGDTIYFRGHDMLGRPADRYVKGIDDTVKEGGELIAPSVAWVLLHHATHDAYLQDQMTRSVAKKVNRHHYVLADSPQDQALVFPVVLVYGRDYLDTTGRDVTVKSDVDASEAISRVYVCDKIVQKNFEG